VSCVLQLGLAGRVKGGSDNEYDSDDDRTGLDEYHKKSTEELRQLLISRGEWAGRDRLKLMERLRELDGHFNIPGTVISCERVELLKFCSMRRLSPFGKPAALAQRLADFLDAELECLGCRSLPADSVGKVTRNVPMCDECGNVSDNACASPASTLTLPSSDDEAKPDLQARLAALGPGKSLHSQESEDELAAMLDELDPDPDDVSLYSTKHFCGNTNA
jgi:hypothetical protein